MAPKQITNEDRIKTGAILDRDGYLRQHNHLEIAKKIMKVFEDAKLMGLITFEHGRLHKEVVKFYLNATISCD